ncbi:metalloregulator ArsR/SmtB family transcription factor [Pseudomaricurvus alkylphenolicus]|nr:metalloregulator ArsR/SmtB family transcription factor [Pseudomaricurvus alkylphenolicus]
MNEYASLFKALSEPVRLRVIYLLAERGELCVCDLVEALELSQSVVSRHLAYLRNNGLVTTRRDGVWVHYQLQGNPAFMGELLSSFKHEAAQSVDFKADLEKLIAVEGAGCC